MTDIVQQIINGLAVGSMYALIALGYTMVYGVLRLINFAHGDVFMVGAFVGCYATRIVQHAMGLNEYADQTLAIALYSIAVAMVICGLLGYTIERFAYRPLRKGSRLSALITAIGVSLFLEYLLQIPWHLGGQRFFGATPTPVPEIAAGAGLKPYHFGEALEPIRQRFGLSISGNDLLTFAATLICLAVLRWIVKYTRTGKAMRAVSVNYDAAQLMGININRIISFTFVLGSALAAVGGVIYGLRYRTIDPLMGILPGLKAFIAAVIGGIGNIPGAALGGILLGLVEALVGYMGWSQYQDAAAFLILILVLLVRPEGIFGHAAPEKV
jgi:branched-chain amino acid transport system permease protein